VQALVPTATPVTPPPVPAAQPAVASGERHRRHQRRGRGSASAIPDPRGHRDRRRHARLCICGDRASIFTLGFGMSSFSSTHRRGQCHATGIPAHAVLHGRGLPYHVFERPWPPHRCLDPGRPRAHKRHLQRRRAGNPASWRFL
jgi:hypothetical protein